MRAGNKSPEEVVSLFYHTIGFLTESKLEEDDRNSDLSDIE